MTLRNDWANGDQFNASDANAVADVANAAYPFPVDGIPATDLVAAVQASLGLADTAVQSVASADITDATTTGKAALTAANAGALVTAAGGFGTTTGTICQGDDTRLSDTRTPADNSVTSAKIVNGTILDADISDSAAIATSKLAAGFGTTSGTFCQGNDSRLPAGADIVNTDISSTAAIALSKLATGYVSGSVNGTATTLVLWTGTAAQYAAIGSKSSSTVYIVTA